MRALSFHSMRDEECTPPAMTTRSISARMLAAPAAMTDGPDAQCRLITTPGAESTISGSSWDRQGFLDGVPSENERVAVCQSAFPCRSNRCPASGDEDSFGQLSSPETQMGAFDRSRSCRIFFSF